MECEVSVDGVQLEHVSEFKYLGCVLDESGTDEAVAQEGGEWEEGCRCYQVKLMLGVCSLSVLGLA